MLALVKEELDKLSMEEEATKYPTTFHEWEEKHVTVSLWVVKHLPVFLPQIVHKLKTMKGKAK